MNQGLILPYIQLPPPPPAEGGGKISEFLFDHILMKLGTIEFYRVLKVNQCISTTHAPPPARGRGLEIS